MTPALSPRARLVVAAVLVVVVLALAGCSEVRPSLCPVCDEAFEDTARANGANVTVEESEVHLYVDEGGAGRWKVRAELSGDGVAALRSNDSLREHVVRTRFDENRGPHYGRRTDVNTAMDGDTLVVRYEIRDVADRGVRDVLLVDLFFREDGDPSDYYLAADRLVMHPPDEWTVLNDPASGTVSSDAMVWKHTPSDDTYVVLGPSRSSESVAAARTTIAVDVARWGGPSIIAATLLPVLILLAGARYLMGTPNLAGLGQPDHLRHADVLASSVASVVGITTVLAVAVLFGQTIAATASTAFMILLAAPSVLFAVAGWLSARGTALRWAPVATAVAIPAPVTAQYVGEWSVFATVAGVGWAIVALAIGVPVFLAVEQTVSRSLDGEAVE